MNLRTIALGSTMVIAASLAAAALIGPRQGISATGESLPRLVTVSGTGEVRQRPDTAIVTTGVTTDAATAQAALARNNTDMTAVLAALKAAGIDEDDIQTSGFNVSPQYKPFEPGQTGSPQIASYQVSNQVTAKVRNLSGLGKTLDTLVRAGSNQISGVSFDVSNPKAALDEARKKAIDDARSHAETYATAAGVSVGAVIQISEVQTAMPQPVRYRAFETAALDASVPISAGQNTLSASVTVVFELR